MGIHNNLYKDMDIHHHLYHLANNNHHLYKEMDIHHHLDHNRYNHHRVNHSHPYILDKEGTYFHHNRYNHHHRANHSHPYIPNKEGTDFHHNHLFKIIYIHHNRYNYRNSRSRRYSTDILWDTTAGALNSTHSSRHHYDSSNKKDNSMYTPQNTIILLNK